MTDAGNLMNARHKLRAAYRAVEELRGIDPKRDLWIERSLGTLRGMTEIVEAIEADLHHPKEKR